MWKLILLLIPITLFAKDTSQWDYILDHTEWGCTLYSKRFKWSKVQINETKVFQFYLGSTRECVRYERRGVM